MICFILLSGVFISKLAVDPLSGYVEELQNLSKETLHELNLPISTITTNTQMLEKNLNDEKSLKRIKRIESACGMLKQRYNELEYLIKKQSKQRIKESFDLHELIHKRVVFLQHLYPHIEFQLNTEETTIFNDPIGMAKVIDNIIDNGVKYSKNSNIIKITLNNYVLKIQDFGIGIDEVELIRIFDNYYQSNKEMQGFGIGLTMVKRFCDNNDIQLSFDSKVDYGTTVILHFKQKNKDKNADK